MIHGLFVLALLAVSPSAAAQTPSTPPPPPAAALAWLLGEVDAHFLRILEGL